MDKVHRLPALEERFKAPVRPPVTAWQYAPVADEMVRNPLSIIPPDRQPRVTLRYAN